MKIHFFDINLRTFLARRLRTINLFNKMFPLGTGCDGRYCYGVWMSHLKRMNENESLGVPNVVAELGPGDSVGVGLAALLSGASQYIALDIQNYYDVNKGLKDFDDILSLFQNKVSINDSFLFPSEIITDEILKLSLSPERLAMIRKELSNPSDSNKIIKYTAPWSDPKFINANSVDFILSQCVLEHVDKLDECYNSMFTWLKSGGYMSHLIDFQCHDFSSEWNGHWFWSEEKWKFVRGTNEWAINRMPASKHVGLAQINGFVKLKLEPLKRKSNLKHSQLAENFKWLTEEDIETRGLFLIAQKA
jgi:hypothetical protein